MFRKWRRQKEHRSAMFFTSSGLYILYMLSVGWQHTILTNLTLRIMFGYHLVTRARSTGGKRILLDTIPTSPNLLFRRNVLQLGNFNGQSTAGLSTVTVQVTLTLCCIVILRCCKYTFLTQQ